MRPVVHSPPVVSSSDAAVRAQAVPVEELVEGVLGDEDDEDAPLVAEVDEEPLSDAPSEEPDELVAAGSLALLLLRLSVR